MTSWQTFKLGEICTMKYGKMPKKIDLVAKGYPVFTGYHVAGYHKEFMFEEPQIIVVARGVGGAGDIKMSPPFAYITNISIALNVDQNRIDKKFLYYRLSSNSLRELRTGAAQPQIIIADLLKYKVNVPPLPHQRRIADILSAYDDLIENNTRRIRILEQMAKAVYQEWFGKVDKESLPKGWEEKTLGDIAQDIRRNVHPNDIDSETPYFGLEHLPRKSIALSEWGKAGDVQSTKLAFKKGEILFGKIRPYFHKVGVAPLDGVASSDTIIITPKSPEYFGLVLGCVFSEEFVNHATQTSQGTKMPRANWDVLVKYPVLVPPKKLLEQFNNTTKDFVELIQNLLFRNRNLRQTRDLLLPRLVSGEIEV
jgi:type I restriction enzyme S subunit